MSGADTSYVKAPAPGATGAAGGDLGGTYPNPTVTSGANHTHASTQVSDSTAAGRTLLTAANAAAQLTAIGAAATVTTTRGDLIRRGASADERVALGAQGTRVTSDGTDAVWSALATAGVDSARPSASLTLLGALYTATDTGVRYVCESDGSGGARWAVQGARGQEGRDTTAVQCGASVYGTTTETITGGAILSYALVFSMRSAPSAVQNLFVHSANSGTDGTQLDIGRDAGDRYLLGVYRYGFGTPQVYLTGATVSGSPTTLHCIAITLDGATVRYSLDGAAVQTVSNGTGAASVNTSVARLAGSMAGTALADAWMTSLVAWSTAVSDADLAIVSGAAKAAGTTPGRIPEVSGATEILRYHASSERTGVATSGAIGTLGGTMTWSAAPTLVIR